MANTNLINTEMSFGKICKKTYIIGILTASTLGLLPVAAQATPKPCCQPTGGDSAVIQTNNQQASVVGKGNAANQNSNQSVNTVSSNQNTPTKATIRPTIRPTVRPTVHRPVHRPVTVPCKK